MVLDAAGGVYRWDLAAGRHSMVVKDFRSSVAQGSANVALSGDGTTMAVEDAAGTGADVYKVSTGALVGEFTDPDGAALVGTNADGRYHCGSAISLDGNGGVMTVGDASGTIYVWNVARRQLIRSGGFNPATTLNQDGRFGRGAPVATLSPDGKLLVVTDDNQGEQDTLWNVATGGNVQPGDTRWPSTWHGAPQVLFTSDGLIVTEPDSNGGADLWDAATRAHVTGLPYPDTLRRLRLDVYAAGPHGREVLSSDGSENTYLWRAP